MHVLGNFQRLSISADARVNFYSKFKFKFCALLCTAAPLDLHTRMQCRLVFASSAIEMVKMLEDFVDVWEKKVSHLFPYCTNVAYSICTGNKGLVGQI